MRLTGGEARGRRLVSPRGSRTRPTSDRIRENLFNILEPPHGARVLDLFCGAGTLGLEALSRGARLVWFVDAGAVPLRALASSVGALGYADRVRVLRAVLPGAIDALRRRDLVFDLVLIDPPYGDPVLESCLKRLGRGDLIATGGRLIAEHDRDQRLEPTYGILRRVDQRRYGRTVLSFYSRDNDIVGRNHE